MSAIEETTAAAEAGKDTHAGGGQPTAAGGVHPAPALTAQVLAQLRTAGLVLPRGPYPGRPWAPRTDAETHLLAESRRLDRARQQLLAELGRMRHGTPHRTAREVRKAAVRAVQRHAADCPLSGGQLAVLAGAAIGERPEETAARLDMPLGTLRSTRARALDRLGALNITHAVALAVAAGWIRPRAADGGDSA
ncbi:putative regulatory protein [Streptomyces scabiei 87.22]|uniref:Putative regulatory protein n=1 Tax=Streptomyces scabiei (strain 87.22) TaxID=680198 RepID=C9ZE38_STRSW|nr:MULTISPECIES: regulatory protein [Streptomyces]MBP5931884.1 hypothetical protein [Streptomyces sp. LBUM 1479]MDX2551358.1 hypothetical protein [Streptomyces stelliscabiei]MDX3051133.1 hypothetical protein [Streptomyces scabiei]MDX3078729.1 hypothetical protein [Streptomyces scabiei]MDX3177545.1 hypothetical protein [Streptomyces scabiei]